MQRNNKGKSGLVRLLRAGLIVALCGLLAVVDALAAPGVILVIGDGMGPQQLGLLQLYQRYENDQSPAARALAHFWQQATLGMVQPYAVDTLVVDSAAAATQLATGRASLSEALGLDQHGNTVGTVLEKARTRGWRTGLVSDTRLTHATPAGFVAHVAHRSEEDLIAVQMLDSGIDVMLSGGWRTFLPPALSEQWQSRFRQAGLGSGSGQRPDGRNLLEEAAEKGYAVALDNAELAMAVKQPQVLGLFAASGMADSLARSRGEHGGQPTLAEMTRSALQMLSRGDTPFFLMVEAGQIDWAGHANDAGYLLGEMLVLQDTMLAVLEFADTSPGSVVVLTADHETGGFGFSYQMYGTPDARSLDAPAFKTKSYRPGYNFAAPDVLSGLRRQTKTLREIVQEFEQMPARVQSPSMMVQLVQKYTGYVLSNQEALRILQVTDNPHLDKDHPGWGGAQVPDMGDDHSFYPYVSTMRSALLGRMLSRQQGVVWSTGTHTSTPVPFWTLGGSQAGLQGLRSQPEAGAWLNQLVDRLPAGKR